MNMKIQQHLSQSGYWVSARITEAVSGQEHTLDPRDIVFLFSLLLCLSPDSSFEDFPLTENGVAINGEEKAIRLIFKSADDVDRTIERFLQAVSALGFGPGGWKLTILKTGSSLAIRTVELPDYESF